MIKLKTEEQIEKMTIACDAGSKVMAEIAQAIKPGISTKDLDKIANKCIAKSGGVPSFKGYNGFPAAICASINEEVVHGIPTAKRILQEGDIISIDLGVYIDGYHSDLARTFPVGKCDDELLNLIEVTKQSFFEGVKALKQGNRVRDISENVQNYAESAGYSVVRDLVGHGIGEDLHESPDIPNFKFRGPNPRLNEGIVVAIEPMINLGTHKVDFSSDGWTVTTSDKKPSAHYENTVALTKDGVKILTNTYI